MLNKDLSLLVGTVGLVVFLAAPSVARGQDEASIRSLPIDRWCAAEAARDIDAKMDLFTDDIVLLVPGEAPVSGLDDVRSWHLRVWEGIKKYQCSGSVDEVQMSGDWGFVRGTFSGTFTDSSGATGKTSGKFMNVVRRSVDGQWKLARVIWNVG